MLRQSLNRGRRYWFQGLAAAAVLSLCQTTHSQTEPAPLKFEVASIKLSRSDPAAPFEISPGGDLTLNTNVKMLVLMAYKLKEYQLVADPKWLESEYYQINAKASAGPTVPDMNARANQNSERLKSLLAERFQFAAHPETRSLQEYDLVIAKGGFKLKEVERHADQFRLSTGKGKIATRGGAKVAMLANLLAGYLHYPVLDKTGLDGYYDIVLNYAPDDSQPDAGPSLFQALQDQLGLKLEPKKGPVEVLVIDHVERPSGN